MTQQFLSCFLQKKVEKQRFKVFSANREPREVLGCCPGNVISNSRTDKRINPIQF